MVGGGLQEEGEEEEGEEGLLVMGGGLQEDKEDEGEEEGLLVVPELACCLALLEEEEAGGL